ARSSNVFRCGRQDVAVPLGFAVLSVLWWLPPGGVAEHHHLLFLQHTGDRSRSQPRQHRQQLPAASPTKKSTLEAPADLLAALPVLRRESPVAVVAVPPRRRCLPERTPKPPHCLCRLSPCADHT